MRAMRTYAKKNECVNEPIGPFTTFSHCVFGYNIRNELISAAKNTEHQYQYDELDSLASDGGVAYAYDAAGNCTNKTENGETITYTLGLSDGLASWMSMGSSSMGSDPMDDPSLYRADPNQEFFQSFPITIRGNGGYTVWLEESDVVNGGEYMVIRSRAKCDENGNIVSANYSKILGTMRLDGGVGVEETVFNPCPNDTNLEFDPKRNLYHGKEGRGMIP